MNDAAPRRSTRRSTNESLRRASLTGFAVLSFVIATVDTAAEPGEFLSGSDAVAPAGGDAS